MGRGQVHAHAASHPGESRHISAMFRIRSKRAPLRGATTETIAREGMKLCLALAEGRPSGRMGARSPAIPRPISPDLPADLRTDLVAGIVNIGLTAGDFTSLALPRESGALKRMFSAAAARSPQKGACPQRVASAAAAAPASAVVEGSCVDLTSETPPVTSPVTPPLTPPVSPQRSEREGACHAAASSAAHAGATCPGWACATCTLINDASVDRCAVCDAKRADAGAAPADARNGAPSPPHDVAPAIKGDLAQPPAISRSEAPAPPAKRVRPASPAPTASPSASRAPPCAEWACAACTLLNAHADQRCIVCGALRGGTLPAAATLAEQQQSRGGRGPGATLQLKQARGAPRGVRRGGARGRRGRR